VASAKKASGKSAAPTKKAAVRQSPAKKTPVKKAQVKKAQVKKSPAKAVKKAVPAKPKKAAAAKAKASAPKKSVPAKPVKKAAPAKKGAPAKVNKSPSVTPVKKVVPAKVAKASAVAPVKPARVAETKPKASAKAAVVDPAPAAPARLVMLPTSRPAKKRGGPQLKPLRFIPKPLVVSEGEEPWTKAELNAVKSDLQRDLVRLRHELESAEVEIADLLRDSGDGAGDDQADAGTKTFEREHELSLVNNARDMVLQSERALARIEDGTYGVCESCGNPIGKARLQAFPRATLCMVCKQREERR